MNMTARSKKAVQASSRSRHFLLQLRGGAAIHGTSQEVLHVIELLDRGMQA